MAYTYGNPRRGGAFIGRHVDCADLCQREGLRVLLATPSNNPHELFGCRNNIHRDENTQPVLWCPQLHIRPPLLASTVGDENDLQENIFHGQKMTSKFDLSRHVFGKQSGPGIVLHECSHACTNTQDSAYSNDDEMLQFALKQWRLSESERTALTTLPVASKASQLLSLKDKKILTYSEELTTGIFFVNRRTPCPSAADIEVISIAAAASASTGGGVSNNTVFGMIDYPTFEDKIKVRPANFIEVRTLFADSQVGPQLRACFSDLFAFRRFQWESEDDNATSEDLPTASVATVTTATMDEKNPDEKLSDDSVVEEIATRGLIRLLHLFRGSKT